MTVTIQLPAFLRMWAAGQREVTVQAQTVGEAMLELVKMHTELRGRLYDERGEIRRFVNIFQNREDIRSKAHLATPLRDGDVLAIVPSIAGGAPARPRESGLPNVGLGQDEIVRYQRHFPLDEVGIAGQQKLKQARVLLVGAGGLGSPVSLYLAAAGVGHIGLVDFDTVDMSNLQRQILFNTADVGCSKVRVAKDHLSRMNPGVCVEGIEDRLTTQNAIGILRDYDVVVDASDNFSTRYVVNRACVELGKPNIYGAIFKFEGQVTVFAPQGACYSCLYAEPPAEGIMPSCADGGVMGALPGIVGSIQAMEVLKWILDARTCLVNRLLVVDAWEMSFQSMELRKDPACSVCGGHRVVGQPSDYHPSAIREAVSCSEESVIDTISPRELKSRIANGQDILVVDVRAPGDHDDAYIPGAVSIPFAQLVEGRYHLESTRETVFVCGSGVRSSQAILLLKQTGCRARLLSLKGGFAAWTRDTRGTDGQS